MKVTLSLAAAALLAGVSFAAAQAPSGSYQSPTSVQQPKQTGQMEERNPNGSTGGSVAHPSPTMGKAASSKHKRSKKHAKKHRSHRSTMGSSMGSKAPTQGQPAQTGQMEERNPNGSTGGSVRHPSPQ